MKRDLTSASCSPWSCLLSCTCWGVGFQRLPPAARQLSSLPNPITHGHNLYREISIRQACLSALSCTGGGGSSGPSGWQDLLLGQWPEEDRSAHLSVPACAARSPPNASPAAQPWLMCRERRGAGPAFDLSDARWDLVHIGYCSQSDMPLSAWSWHIHTSARSSAQRVTSCTKQQPGITPHCVDQQQCPSACHIMHTLLSSWGDCVQPGGVWGLPGRGAAAHRHPLHPRSGQPGSQHRAGPGRRHLQAGARTVLRGGRVHQPAPHPQRQPGGSLPPVVWCSARCSASGNIAKNVGSLQETPEAVMGLACNL